MWMDSWVLNLPYDLWPSYQTEPRVLFRFFESHRTVVVLSSSNDPQTEVHADRCENMGIPILRRRGGGGTVVLTPGCLILTVACYVKELYNNRGYFYSINQAWINSLSKCGIDGLTQAGTSDIVAATRKVAGTSLFRKQNLLVYQGSLLVAPDLRLITTLLRHPSREPNYRGSRDHETFLTSLKTTGVEHSVKFLADQCSQTFAEHLRSLLGDHLIEAPKN